MEGYHNAVRQAVLEHIALTITTHPSPEQLIPIFKNLMTIPGPDVTPEAITKYQLEVEFYSLLQVCGKGFAECKLRSEDENVTQDQIDSYINSLWELVLSDYRAQTMAFFEKWAARKAESEDADGTGGIEELFGRLNVG